MTDSMKFGPEWLRNLSSEGNTSTLSGGGTRYHLAEHRYGREEMLALFEQSLKLRPPHSMSTFKTLYVEQALNPLALAPMTEDENRLWSTRTVPPGAPRGRGGSMDRGRGRGRGGTFHPGFSRSNSAYDEPTRPFDRNQSDRGWSERNGDLGDWGGSTSPRKDYGNSRGGAITNDNWRRHRGAEDTEPTDGWRANTTANPTTPGATNPPNNHNTSNNTSSNNHRPSSLQDLKWGPARNISGNWRDGDSRDDQQLSDRQATNRISWHSDTGRNQTQRKMFDLEDHLPEWATENPSEAGGTFDASGAFHGSDADDDFTEKKYHKSNSLQKSASQQNVIHKKANALSTSQSATNLIKKTDDPQTQHPPPHQHPSPHQHPAKPKDPKHQEDVAKTKKETIKETQPEPTIQKHEGPETNKKTVIMDVTADEFDHMKEVTDDIVAKLILDDEIQPKQPQIQQQQQQQIDQKPAQTPPQVSNYAPNLTNVPPPPGSGALNDKWYYRDPQGEVQGPFTAQEMSDWFRAGYFTVSLLVRRHIDERYFTLGDLVKQCPGSIPFLTCRLPPLKAEISAPFGKVELNDPVQQIHMQRLLQRHAETIRTLSQTEPWNGMSNVQQRELVTQHMMQQPQVLSDLPFIPPVANSQMSNPLMHMISQMQQANKLPIEKNPANHNLTNLTNHNLNHNHNHAHPHSQHLDPLQQLVQQMGGLQANAMAPPSPLPPMPPLPQVDTTKKEDPIQSLLRQLANQPQRDYWNMRPTQQTPPQQPPPQPSTQWINQQLNVAAAGIPTHSMWDLHPTQQAQHPQVPQPQHPQVPHPQSQPQPQPQPQIPVSQQIPMPPSSIASSLHNSLMPQNIEAKETGVIAAASAAAVTVEDLKKKAAELEKEQKQKERKEQAEREKRKKEQEHLEKLKQQKEQEEKRKEEQKKMEAVKKAEMEKAKKLEEKIRKELEKVNREAEEKCRELEKKRKQKEQRKAEEESRRKQEEERKQQQEEEAKRKEVEKQREEQSRRQAEALRKMQEQQQQQRTKVAPWCQSGAPGGASSPATATSLSLAEIQRAEREKRAAEAALLLQQQKALAATVAKETLEQQALADKNSTMQLKWATKKPLAPKKIKSLAEIQAEEQERVAKQLAEQRLAQQQKEKELAPIAAHAASSSIWSSASQSLTWNTQTPQAGGFWDEAAAAATTTQTAAATTTPPPVVVNQASKPAKQNNKPAAAASVAAAQATLLNNQINNNKTQPAQPKTAKSRAKKEEENIRKLFDKNAANNDEFTAWCMKTLATLNSDVDIPTFVGFLFDIESPYEIKDYVRQYLGDSTHALHFANQFIERRSKMKNLERTANQHKDDLCMPAPAINPSVEFQEVKGKGKKMKKSKMTKVDNRILGFSVTAAENRINVGDRDYGDNV